MTPLEKYDLTHKMAPFLDVHLVFPLLEFLEENTSYDKEAVQRARLELLTPTKMIDYAIEIQGENPEMEARREAVFEMMDSFESKELSTEENLEYAKFLYECGDYQSANKILEFSESLPSLWGKFASEILLKNWDNALKDIYKIKSLIDGSPLYQLQQKSWLLHWSLFVFFNHEKGHDSIIDLFTEFFQVIQTNCPWLFRYYLAAIIITRSPLVHVASDDPVAQFLECLSRFDIDAAQSALRDCEIALKADYFLCNCATAFMDASYDLCFETYCKIHTTISIDELASKLNKDKETAEHWIVDLIRKASLHAKIHDNCVIMRHPSPSVYSQVIDKTKDLHLRSTALVKAIQTKIAQADSSKLADATK